LLSLGREAYDGGVSVRDLGDMLPHLFRLTTYNFMRLVWREWVKVLSTRAFLAEARQLVPELRPSDLGARWSGIRAQLVDSRGRLVDDLVVERTARSLHVLNAVSPALTCALPFADEVAIQSSRMRVTGEDCGNRSLAGIRSQEIGARPPI